MPLHTVGATFKTDAGQVPLSGTVYNVAAEVNALIPSAAVSTNIRRKIEFLYGEVNDYVLCVGTQTVAQAAAGTYSEAAAGSLVIKVNSTDSPVPEITLQAKQPHAFAPCLAGTTNEFTANVTDFYITNAGSADLVLVVHVGLNVV